MNIKTVMAARRVTEHLEAMFVPLHRLAFPEGSHEPDEIRDIFYHLCEARTKAAIVSIAVSAEFEHGAE